MKKLILASAMLACVIASSFAAPGVKSSCCDPAKNKAACCNVGCCASPCCAPKTGKAITAKVVISTKKHACCSGACCGGTCCTSSAKKA